MNFNFTEEERDILDMLHDFCIKQVAPLAAELDEEEKCAGFNLPKPTKQERWGRVNFAHKKISRYMVSKSRNNSHE